MSDRVTFYHNPQSRGRAAHWMLEEIGAPYDTKIISFEKGEQKAPAYLAINPMGKIPAIVHRGVVVTESAAILTYLADAFPAAKLAPAVSDPARGAYYRWLFFGAGCVEPAVIDKMLSRPTVEKRIALGYGTYADTVDTLAKAVEKGPYLLGEQFTAADVYIAGQIGFGLMTKALEPRPAFKPYLDRCMARPAFQRALAADTPPAGKSGGS